MKKIKILQFPIANSQGGITQYVLNNWRFINKDRFRFDFATMSKDLDMKEMLEAQGCKVHFISCYAEENKDQFIKEIREILKEHYDIIHLHTKQWKSFLVEEIAREYGVPRIIVHSHSTGIDTLDPAKRKKEAMLHETVQKTLTMDIATDYWACSWLAAEFLYGDRIPKDYIKILRNTIDVNRFSYNEQIRNSVRRKLNLEGFFVLGNVGRMVFQKNQEFLLELMKKMPKGQEDIRLLFVGTGELEEDLKRKVEEYKLGQKVIFLGMRRDVNEILQAMDVLLLPSRFEGLPLTLIEAQTSGIKCLASDTITEEAKITSNLEYLPLDVDRWIESIIKMKGNIQRENMTQQVIDAGFDNARGIEYLEALYEGRDE